VKLDNEQLIRNFIATWSSLDVEEILSYFADDGTYHNMPIAPVTGRENLRAFIAAFLTGWTSTDWDIINITCQNDTVFAERMDRTKIGNRSVDLPCCGVFEMAGGKIKVWRDYFDMATYTKGATA
jgi:limonene-1,2-epoxide hydrolase